VAQDGLRDEIVARVRLEDEVRQELKRQKSEPPAPARGRFEKFLDSKVGALVATAILSGLLVPAFQCSQERAKWRQQNRYDALQRQLVSIRECLKQFVEVQKVTGELYTLGLSLVDGSTPRSEAARQRLESLGTRRIEQNSAFAASLFFLPGAAQASLRKEWNRMIGSVQGLDGAVADLLKAPPDGTAIDRNEAALTLGDRLDEVNLAYDELVGLLQQRLQEVENASLEYQPQRPSRNGS
jgi:hypothetical protein